MKYVIKWADVSERGRSIARFEIVSEEHKAILFASFMRKQGALNVRIEYVTDEQANRLERGYYGK